MNRTLASTALSALLFAQGMLGAAGLATVVIKHRQTESAALTVAVAAPETAVR